MQKWLLAGRYRLDTINDVLMNATMDVTQLNATLEPSDAIH